MTTRDKGYYWIKWSEEEGWIVGKWSDDGWSICESGETYRDESKFEIGAKIDRLAAVSIPVDLAEEALSCMAFKDGEYNCYPGEHDVAEISMKAMRDAIEKAKTEQTKPV
jgi:hypothetical protein